MDPILARWKVCSSPVSKANKSGKRKREVQVQDAEAEDVEAEDVEAEEAVAEDVEVDVEEVMAGQNQRHREYKLEWDEPHRHPDQDKAQDDHPNDAVDEGGEIPYDASQDDYEFQQ